MKIFLNEKDKQYLKEEKQLQKRRLVEKILMVVVLVLALIYNYSSVNLELTEKPNLEMQNPTNEINNTVFKDQIDLLMKLIDMQTTSNERNVRLLDSLINKNDTLFFKPNTNFLELTQTLDSVVYQVESIKQKQLALRQAINPKNPEEVLTIARLTDDLDALRKDFISLKSTLLHNQSQFRDYMLREKESNNTLLLLISGALIPLILGSLSSAYTVWKSNNTSHKSDNSKKEEKSEE